MNATEFILAVKLMVQGMFTIFAVMSVIATIVSLFTRILTKRHKERK